MTEPNDSLQLDKSRLNQMAKRLAKPLSKLVTSGPFLRASRYADAYLNVLVGKGAGTGWAISGEVEAAVSTIVRAEPTVFDIGANKGEWTQILLQRIPASRVFLFEPAVDCHEFLRPLFSNRVTLVPSAVGAEKGSAELWSSEATDGAASLHRRKDSYFAGREFRSTPVQVTTIDDFMKQSAIEVVDFVKLDIEGHELAALQGARDALQGGKIRALSFEFGSSNINSRTYFRDFWDLLNPLGYRLARITPGGRLLPIQPYSEDLEYFRGVTNYVAVRDGAHTSPRDPGKVR